MRRRTRCPKTDAHETTPQRPRTARLGRRVGGHATGARRARRYARAIRCPPTRKDAASKWWKGLASAMRTSAARGSSRQKRACAARTRSARAPPGHAPSCTTTAGISSRHRQAPGAEAANISARTAPMRPVRLVKYVSDVSSFL